MRRLEHWAAVLEASDEGEYTLPEVPFALTGRLYGAAGIAEGAAHRTARIVGHRGTMVTTANGRLYQLGEPSEAYTEWMRR